MGQLTVTALQLGLLALLWVFVIAVIGVLRRDLFGPRVMPRTAAGRPARPPRPARTSGTPPAGAPAAPAAAGPATPPRPSPSGAVPRSLVVTEGPLTGTQLPLGPSPVVIGRAPDCTLVLPDDYASGHHAQLVPREGAWFLEDLGSTNGTLVGRGAGTKVEGAVRVATGSVVRIGRTTVELRR